MTEPEEPQLLETLLGTLFRPRRTFAELGALASSKHGGAGIALLGMLWGLLSFLLWSSGREPPFVLVPIPQGQYYLVQGLFMLPLVTALWWLYSEVAFRLAGADREPGTRTALAFAYAVPMLVHVSLEMLVYLLGGFERLAPFTAVALPLASLWVWALASLALRALHGVSWPRAIGASFAGLFVQAAAGALILR